MNHQSKAVQAEICYLLQLGGKMYRLIWNSLNSTCK